MDKLDEIPPPPYEGPEDYDSCDIVQPAILVLTGRLISPESSSTAGGSTATTTTTPPFWELDHDVSYLSSADHKAEFFRHETRVRHSTTTTTTRTRRSHKRHLFSLENPHALLTATNAYAWFLTSVSRRTLGHVGLKKKKTATTSATARSGFKVLRICNNRNSSSRSGGGGGGGGGGGDDEDEELFEITRVEGRYEWWDPEGNRVAIEDCVDGRCRMIVTRALPRQKADVAMWCLRLWHDASQTPSLLSGFKRKFGIGQ